MRKAALVIGIIAAVFAGLGAVLKLIDFPGGSLSLVLGTLLFLIFSILLLIFQLKHSVTPLRKVAVVCGFITALTLGVGLLGLALQWPGTILVLTGMVFTAAFIGTFFGSMSKEPGTKLIGGLTVVVVLFYASLGLGWMKAEQERSEVRQKMAEFALLQEKFQAESAKGTELFRRYSNDTIADGADELFISSTEMVMKIEAIQSELVDAVNGYDHAAREEFYLAHPLDFDTPTWLLVGENPAMPGGRAVGLRETLETYRNEALSPEIPLDIDLSREIDGKHWASANFYHVTAIDAAARLLQMEIKVLEAQNAALEKRIFVNE
jgi:hypothetical protein